MQPWNTYSAGRWNRAEKLESRRLLSSAGGDDGDVEVDGDLTRLVRVQVVEVLEMGPADDEDGDDETTIESSELPAAVREALESTYPGAEIIEVEVELEDDEAEYDVSARFQETVVEVSISPDGEITETSQVLSRSELPPEVLDWIEANFDDPAVLEIELVSEDGETSYELQIAPEDGSPVEVTLQLNQIVVEPGAMPAEQAPDPFGQTTGAANLTPEETVVADAATPATPPQTIEDRTATAAAEPVAVAAPEAERDPPADIWTPAWEAPAVASTQELAAEVAEKALLLPALLIRAMQMDLGSVDEQLQQLLREIDELAQGAASVQSGGSGGLRLALILAMIAGAQVFRNDALTKRPVSALFMETDRASSWTRWSSTTMRK